MFAEGSTQDGLAKSWQATTTQVQTEMGNKYTLKLKLVKCLKDYTRTTCTTSVLKNTK